MAAERSGSSDHEEGVSRMMGMRTNADKEKAPAVTEAERSHSYHGPGDKKECDREMIASEANEEQIGGSSDSLMHPYEVQKRMFGFETVVTEDLPLDLQKALKRADETIRAEMEKPLYLETMRSFTREVAAFPYIHDLKIPETLYIGLPLARSETMEWADEKTDNGARLFLNFCSSLRPNFLAIMVELELMAEESPEEFEKTGLRIDQHGHLELESIGATLSISPKKGLPLGYVGMVNGTIEPYLAIRRAQDLFDIVHALCEIGLDKWIAEYLGYLDYGKTTYKKRETRQKRLTAQKITASNDAVSNALFYRPEGYFTPQDYMTGQPKPVRTGAGIQVSVTLSNDFAIDEVFDAYQLDSKDRLWHDMALSLAAEGHETFRGSDLLSLAGYKKPSAKGMQKTMAECSQSLMKMRRHDVLIDATEENRAYKSRRGADLNKATRITKILDADITLLNFEDGVNDFTVSLKTSGDSSPISAFALGSYAKEKKQLITYSGNDFVFDGLSLRDEHRRMWKYVIHRLREHKTSNTIRVDTLLKNTNLEDIKPDKRDRLISQLRKMLDIRKADALELKTLRDKERSGTRLTLKERSRKEILESMTLIEGYKIKRQGRGGMTYAFEIEKEESL